MRIINFIKKKLHERYFYKNSIGVSLEERNIAKYLQVQRLTKTEICLVKNQWQNVVIKRLSWL